MIKLPKADGDAGARRAIALLGIAACAETANATLSEDYAKVDIKISFRHAFRPEKLVTVHAQVKSGRSFRLSSSDSSTIKLNITRETIEALGGLGMQGLIIWVPPLPQDRLYWYAKDPRRPPKSPLQISREQYIRPSIRYDLSRLYDYSAWRINSPRLTMSKTPIDRLLGEAKAAYKELKSTPLKHPIVGQLGVTRLAWRHITRRSKSSSRRSLALRVVPYLKWLMQRAPDRYVINSVEVKTCGKETQETRVYLCWYRGSLRFNDDNYSVLLRIKELITYPTNWQERPLSVRDIKQTATLASWWCKKN